MNNSAKWDGTEWSALEGPSGTGVRRILWDTDIGRVYSLAVYDDGTGLALYVGGRFATAGGITVNKIARWDGTEWSALNGPSGTGLDYEPRSLAVYDDGSGEALYACGINIRKWDGTEWSVPSGSPKSNRDPVTGSPWQDTPPTWFALAVYDDGNGEALYAGGEHGYFKKWNGVEWRYLPECDGSINALAVLNDGRGETLYAGVGLPSRVGSP